MRKRLLLFSSFLSLLFVLVLTFLFSKKVSAPQWMREQIKEDLSFYASEHLQPPYLNKYFNQSTAKELLVYYRVYEGQLYYKCNWPNHSSNDRLIKTTKFLNKVVSKTPLNNLEFVLTVHDGLRKNDYRKDLEILPAFCYAKEKDENGILLPDPLSVDFAKKGRKSISRSNLRRKYNWSHKQELAFWRGGTTGKGKGKEKSYSSKSWYNQPRTQLALLTKYHPSVVNAGFVSFPGVDQDVLKEMDALLPKASWTVHKDHLLYKYLVIPDGNTCTYPRYYLALLSNSVAFKQNSAHIQWFYKALKAYEHYVPVEFDFSNLPEQVVWAQNNDDQVKRISKESTRWAKKNLTYKSMQVYVQTLLKEFSEVQQSVSDFDERDWLKASELKRD